MSLQETLTAEMKAALKAHEKERLGTVRMLLAEVQNATIEKRGPLSEAEELELLARQAKRRRESIEAFEKGGRHDLAEKERAELALIEGYLPQQLSVDEVRALVREAMAAVGASGKRDMGKVMSHVMPQLKGRFPGKDVRPLVDELLGD
jgi:uncharacterized protein